MAILPRSHVDVLTHETYLSHQVQQASHGGRCRRGLAWRQCRSNGARETMVFEPDEKAGLLCAGEPRLIDPRIAGAHVRIDQRSGFMAAAACECARLHFVEIDSLRPRQGRFNCCRHFHELRYYVYVYMGRFGNKNLNARLKQALSESGLAKETIFPPARFSI